MSFHPLRAVLAATMLATALTSAVVSSSPSPAGAATAVAAHDSALRGVAAGSYGRRESIQYAKSIFITSIGGQQLGRYSRLDFVMFGPSGGRQGQVLANASFAPDVIGKGDQTYAFRGEVIQINDTARDGYRVAVRWTNSGGKKGMCINKQGSERGYTAFCDLPNLAEGTKTRVKLGRCNGSITGCDEFSDWEWWNRYTSLADYGAQLKKRVWLDYTDDANSSPDGGECTEIATRRDC